MILDQFIRSMVVFLLAMFIELVGGKNKTFFHQENFKLFCI